VANGVVKILASSSKLVTPVKPYIREQPKSRIPEEKAPKIKYFNPASVGDS
jgi:hypothetical protein